VQFDASAFGSVHDFGCPSIGLKLKLMIIR
jgi:hypothetical protein